MQLGTPLPTIAILGRWQSERSMREYLRLCELALIRIRQQVDPKLAIRHASLARGVDYCWDYNPSG